TLQSSGQCQGSGSPSPPSPAWTDSFLLCTLPSGGGGGCAPGLSCVANLGNSCVAAAATGPMTCPQGYPVEKDYFEQFGGTLSSTCASTVALNGTTVYSRLTGFYSAPTCNPQPPSTNKGGISYHLEHVVCCQP